MQPLLLLRQSPLVVPKDKEAPKKKKAAAVQSTPTTTSNAQLPKRRLPVYKRRPAVRRETEIATSDTGTLSAEMLSVWVQDLIPKLLAARDHKTLSVIMTSLMTLLARDE